MAQSQPLHPTVLWAQTKDAVFLTVDLQDVTDLKVDLTEDTLSYDAKAHDQQYHFDLTFPEQIKKDASKYNTQRNVQFKLVKEKSGRWKDLAKSGKAHWIKVDWAKWVDTDDEETASANFGGDFDMGGMNFGDMGGMGGMGGDSDDEDDLPDLDGPVPPKPSKDGEDDDDEEDDEDDEPEETAKQSAANPK